MTDYNKQYYFLREPMSDARIPFLTPDRNTSDRNFAFEKQPLGSPSLIFHNANKQQDLRKNVHSITSPILFAGFNMVVRDDIRDRLLTLDLPNVALHPAVYIDNKDIWHEDYWYVTFTERLDCWDRQRSDFDDESGPIEVNGVDCYSIFKFSLDKNILEKIPLKDRLLFKMGGAIDAMPVCHESLSSIFQAGGKGITLTPIEDY